jgi:hypothetical protein
MTTSAAQAEVCARLGLEPDPPGPRSKVGLAIASRSAGWPLTGIRHRPVGDTNGWYLWWGGEPSSARGFFDPLHVEHLAERCPDALPYLALPPGWAFVVAPGHEDVWFDEKYLVEDDSQGDD